MKTWGAGFVLVVAFGTAIGACEPAGRATDGAATVEHVIDGDTIDVRIGGRTERVRLIGIDTPETKKPNTPIQCYGPEASAFTESLLPTGTEVWLERDVVGRDDYGRLLGYIYLTAPTSPNTSADDFVNLVIVRRGYATPLTIEPNSAYARDFADAARAAEADDIGLWAACSP